MIVVEFANTQSAIIQSPGGVGVPQKPYKGRTDRVEGGAYAQSWDYNLH